MSILSKEYTDSLVNDIDTPGIRCATYHTLRRIEELLEEIVYNVKNQSNANVIIKKETRKTEQ